MGMNWNGFWAYANAHPYLTTGCCLFGAAGVFQLTSKAIDAYRSATIKHGATTIKLAKDYEERNGEDKS